MPVGRTVAAQLGLLRDTGLVVRRVAEGNPAAGVLQEHDILTKLDDQRDPHRDMHQLSVLDGAVAKRAKTSKLTFMRGGKETTAKAKLGEREVPKLAGDMMMPGFGGVAGGDMFFQLRGGGHGFSWEMGGPEAGDVMRLIGGDRMHWFADRRGSMSSNVRAARVRPSSICPGGNFSYSS